MMSKVKALCLVLVLMGAIFVGQYWATPALLFLVQVACALLIEMAASRLSWGNPSRDDG